MRVQPCGTKSYYSKKQEEKNDLKEKFEKTWWRVGQRSREKKLWKNERPDDHNTSLRKRVIVLWRRGKINGHGGTKKHLQTSHKFPGKDPQQIFTQNAQTGGEVRNYNLKGGNGTWVRAPSQRQCKGGGYQPPNPFCKEHPLSTRPGFRSGNK